MTCPDEDFKITTKTASPMHVRSKCSYITYKVLQMNIHPKLRPIFYGLGAFAIFTVLSVVLKFVTNHTATPDEYFGILSNKDLLLGAVVALILTFTHERRKKLK